MIQYVSSNQYYIVDVSDIIIKRWKKKKKQGISKLGFVVNWLVHVTSFDIYIFHTQNSP